MWIFSNRKKDDEVENYLRTIRKLKKDIKYLKKKLPEGDRSKKITGTSSITDYSIVGIKDGILKLEEDYSIKYMNSILSKLLNVSQDDTIGRHISMIDNLDWGKGFLEGILRQASKNGNEIIEHKEVWHQDRQEMCYYNIKANQIGSSYQIIFEDVTKLKNTSLELEEVNQQLEKRVIEWRSVVKNVPDIIMTLNNEGIIFFMNKPVQGLTLVKMRGFNFLNVLAEEYRELFKVVLNEVIKTGKTDSIEVKTLPEFGAVWYSCRMGVIKQEGQIDYAIVTASDFTERKRLLDDNYIRSITDEVTGLYNRVKLETDLKTDGEKILVLLNVNNFSSINVAFGMHTGNQILHQLGERLNQLVPEHARLYRLESDEFILLMYREFYDIVDLVKSINEKINHDPITYEGIDVSISFSGGIVMNETVDLLNKANLALLEAQKQGKGVYLIYNYKMNKEALYRNNIDMIKKVKEALEHDKIIPYFQGIIDNETKKIVKYECLARMVENKKIISPINFLPSAKQSGLLPNITKVMFEKSVLQLEHSDCDFSINITYEDLINNNFIDFLSENLKENKFDPAKITFEVLESISVSSYTEVINRINILKSMGFKIAVDDFGTEYSNFASLLELRADFIKIDGRFIKNVHVDVHSQKIVKAITDFSHNIGAKVIAEYVHSVEVQEMVCDFEIDYSQGFLFSEPKATIIE